MTLLFDDGGGGEINLNRNILENGFRHNFFNAVKHVPVNHGVSAVDSTLQICSETQSSRYCQVSTASK